MSIVAGQDARAQSQRSRYEAHVKKLRDIPESALTLLEKLVLDSASGRLRTQTAEPGSEARRTEQPQRITPWN